MNTRHLQYKAPMANEEFCDFYITWEIQDNRKLAEIVTTRTLDNPHDACASHGEHGPPPSHSPNEGGVPTNPSFGGHVETSPGPHVRTSPLQLKPFLHPELTKASQCELRVHLPSHCNLRIHQLVVVSTSPLVQLHDRQGELWEVVKGKKVPTATTGASSSNCATPTHPQPNSSNPSHLPLITMTSPANTTTISPSAPIQQQQSSSVLSSSPPQQPVSSTTSSSADTSVGTSKSLHKKHCPVETGGGSASNSSVRWFRAVCIPPVDTNELIVKFCSHPDSTLLLLRSIALDVMHTNWMKVMSNVSNSGTSHGATRSGGSATTSTPNHSNEMSSSGVLVGNACVSTGSSSTSCSGSGSFFSQWNTSGGGDARQKDLIQIAESLHELLRLALNTPSFQDSLVSGKLTAATDAESNILSDAVDSGHVTNHQQPPQVDITTLQQWLDSRLLQMEANLMARLDLLSHKVADLEDKYVSAGIGSSGTPEMDHNDSRQTLHTDE